MMLWFTFHTRTVRALRLFHTTNTRACGTYTHTHTQTVDDNGIKKCVIREIDPGSSASEEPSLNIGDTIICVNGKNCYGMHLLKKHLN